MSHSSYYIAEYGAVHTILYVSSSEIVHLPPNHTEVTNKWSSKSCDPYDFIICKHITSTLMYCLQLLHKTWVSTWICVFVYNWYKRLRLLCVHRAAHIQHIVICVSFNVDITTVCCLFFILFNMVCYLWGKLFKWLQ